MLEFKGLKTQSSYNFKNKKEETIYWNSVLLESALRYKTEFEKAKGKIMEIEKYGES